MQKRFLLYLMITVVGSALYSQVALEQQNQESTGFGLGLELGAKTFNEFDDNPVTYQELSLNPEFVIGPVGIGMAFTFHFQIQDNEGNFNFREEDWIPDSERSFLDIYLPLFRYVRYGNKGEALYAKIGSIEDGTLGNGFLMGSYSNTHFLPERRIVGLALDLDGQLFDIPIVGLETFTGNLAKFDLFGSRFFVRPLGFTNIPLAKDLQTGVTLAVDRLPEAHYDFTSIDSETEMVSMYSFDLKQPLLSKPALSLAIYGEMGFQPGNDELNTGGLIGFGGNLVSFINYGLNLLLLGDNYVPFYFDNTYDLYRERKYSVYSGAIQTDGYLGWLASLGFSFFEEALVFNTSVDGSFTIEADKDYTYPHLKAVLKVGEGVLPGIYFDASYDKKYIRDFNDLISPEDAVVGASINYKTGPAVITLGYDLRYKPEDGSWETTAQLSSALSLM